MLFRRFRQWLADRQKPTVAKLMKRSDLIGARIYVGHDLYGSEGRVRRVEKIHRTWRLYHDAGHTSLHSVDSVTTFDGEGDEFPPGSESFFIQCGSTLVCLTFPPKT